MSERERIINMFDLMSEEQLEQLANFADSLMKRKSGKPENTFSTWHSSRIC